MKQLLIILASINVMFLFMHELDAIYHKEWQMFAFLKKLSPNTQYLVFLYSHIPLCLFLFYYLWTVFHFSSIFLWILLNGFSVVHLILHLFARKWRSNVFQGMTSFGMIVGAGITGAVNLCLSFFY